MNQRGKAIRCMGVRLRFARVIACAMTCIALFPGGSWAAGDELLGAASHRHLWLILEPRGKETAYQLVQHPWDESGWQYRTQHTMTQPPVAMAAIDDAVWLVMPPRKVGDTWRREVFTATVQKNAATGLYYTMPAGRLEMAPSLEGLGRIAGFVATSKGPVVLILPTPRAATPVNMPVASEPQPPLEKPTLLRLESGASEWREIALPPDFVGTRSARLGVADDRLALIDSVPENANRILLHMAESDGVWTTTAHPFDAREVKAMTSLAGQIIAVSTSRSGEGRFDFTYLRPGGPLALSSIDSPKGKWLAEGFNGRLIVVERERGGSNEPALTVRTIDPLTAALSPPLAFVEQPLTAGKMWQLTLALGLSLSAVLVIILLRPPPASAITVDPHTLLPIGRRFGGLVIDLAIAAIPTMLYLDCSANDLLSMPMVTADFDRSAPYAMMTGIATAIATLFELFTCRSIGKMIVGGRIVSIDGSRPKWWRILTRGGLRWMVMLVPPLAVFALTNSHMQGVADMAARTVVLGKPPDAGAESANPQ